MTYVCHSDTEVVSRSRLTNLQQETRHRAEVSICGEPTLRRQVGSKTGNQGAGPAARGGTAGEGALTRLGAGAARGNPAPRPGSPGSLLPGCGCGELRDHLASAAGTTSTSAVPDAQQNASMSRGGRHLWGGGEKMKLSEGRMWKQKASQQKDVSATYQCLQVRTIPKSSRDI